MSDDNTRKLYFEVTVPDPTRVPLVERQIQAYLADADEEGSTLTPVSTDRYVVAEGAIQQLRLRAPDGNVLKLLVHMPEVTNVRQVLAEDLEREFLTRKTPRRTEADVAGPLAGRSWLERQTNLTLVKAPAAWRRFGENIDFSEPPWRHIRVGHMDTGYTEHLVLGPWMDHRSPIVAPHEGMNFMESGELPRDPLEYDGNPGHGTRTGTMLAGYLEGVFHGAAPGVRMIPYRVTNNVAVDVLFHLTELCSAIEHAVLDSNCQVISISLGDPCMPRERLARAIDLAYEEGVIVVAAAGNIVRRMVYPARFARTIGVTGVTANGKPWVGSSRGKRADISAQADDVFRPDIDIDAGGPDSWKKGSGTSYATPVVAGAAALWLAFHGEEIARRYRGWQRVEAFRQILRSTARLPEPGWGGGRFGAGILDMEALLDSGLPDPATLEQAVSAGRESDRVQEPTVA